MADDSLGLRGWAQIVQQPSSQLYPLARLAQMKAENDREYQRKVAADNEDWFQREAKLNFPKVRTELQQGLQHLFLDTTRGMNEMHRQSFQTGQMDRSAISNLKANYDSTAAMAEAFQGDLDQISTLVNNDKEKIFNQSAMAQEVKSIVDDFYQLDNNGRIVGINMEATNKLADLQNNYKMYDPAAISQKHVNMLGQMAMDEIQDKGSYLTGTKTSFTNSLYEIDPKSQKPKIDAKTGKPIPLVTGEAVALWDADPIRKQWLDEWSKETGGDRGKAYKKNFVDKFGSVKTDVTATSNPSYSRGEQVKEQYADTRFQTLLKAVVDRDAGALAQAYSNNDRTVAVFSKVPAGKNPLTDQQLADAQVGMQDKGAEKPDRIIIYKREMVQPGMLERNFTPKYSDWLPFQEIPLNSEQDTEAALVKLNNVFDESLTAGSQIGQEPIRVRINKWKADRSKAPKEVDLGFPEPK